MISYGFKPVLIFVAGLPSFYGFENDCVLKTKITKRKNLDVHITRLTTVTAMSRSWDMIKTKLILTRTNYSIALI